MIDELKKQGIIMQVTMLFLIGTLVIGLLTYFSERSLANNEVRFRVEHMADDTASEVALALKEYPAYKWLAEYWYEHYEEMDIEYDVDFTQGTKTEEKCHILGQAYPEFTLKYGTAEEVQAMSEEHQKLYAEIIYTWFITRINEIKRIYGADYLFGVFTKDPYEDQFFLFSAADEGTVRGTNYEEVYPLGVQVKVSESQQFAMKNAEQDLSHLASAGAYMDYYAYVDTIGDQTLLIGLTYNVDDMAAEVKYSTVSGTIGAMIFQIALALACMAMIYHFVLKPLKEVQQNIRIYKENKDSKVVTENLASIKAKNEIGELSSDVSELAVEIDHYLDEISSITKEREKIVAELELASNIQSSQLPSIFPAFPDRKEFDIFATMDPAREVGGDFYDFFMVDDDHLCVVIADVSGKGIPAARREQCVGCGKCVRNCFSGALTLAGIDMTPERAMEEILTDLPYFEASGGGVTFSGGECMLQIDFLETLCALCGGRGIHTAVDTAGNVPWPYFERLLPYRPLFLYDVKARDPGVHRRLTGADNGRILDNLGRLFESGARVWIRVPCVPGGNIGEMDGIADRLAGKPVERVELLAYHRLGGGKRRLLGLGEDGNDFRVPDGNEMNAMLEKFLKRGVNARIG